MTNLSLSEDLTS